MMDLIPYRARLEAVRLACLVCAIAAAFLVFVGLWGEGHSAFLPAAAVVVATVCWLSWVHDRMIIDHVLGQQPDRRPVPGDIEARRQVVLSRAKAASIAFDAAMDAAIELSDDFAHIGQINEELMADREHLREMQERLAEVADLAAVGTGTAPPSLTRSNGRVTTRSHDVDPVLGEGPSPRDNGEPVPGFLLGKGGFVDA